MNNESVPQSDEQPRAHVVVQLWTEDGYPIVDGKYQDLSTGELKTVEGGRTIGPPSLSVFWHNKHTKRERGSFISTAFYSPASVTEYLARVGEFLSTGVCEVDSLCATKYSVNLIITTQLSDKDFTAALKKHKLVYSLV